MTEPEQPATMTSGPATYAGHRFPVEIISRAVWLHHVFSLCLPDVEQALAERGSVTFGSLLRLRFQAVVGSQIAA